MFSNTAIRSMGVHVSVLALCLTTACSENAPTGATSAPSSTAPAMSLATAAAAATIKLEVRVPGYSQSGNNGWILVNSSCGGGGRVVRGGTPNACTDRVARGESIRVTISSGQSSQSKMLAFTGVSSSNGFSAGSIVTLPQSGTFVVSKDPTFDDVYISVILLSPTSVPFGTAQQRRVPIGSRP